jgi:hypothetical protein
MDTRDDGQGRPCCCLLSQSEICMHVLFTRYDFVERFPKRKNAVEQISGQARLTELRQVGDDRNPHSWERLICGLSDRPQKEDR